MKIVNSFKELLEALDLKPGDTIEFTGSQHNRSYEIEIDFIPSNKLELEAIIETASDENLFKMGVGLWSVGSDKSEKDNLYLEPGQKHFLFPYEWYDSIPNGFEVIDIFGEKEKFQKGVTDDDRRFGCLCYGFIR